MKTGQNCQTSACTIDGVPLTWIAATKAMMHSTASKAQSVANRWFDLFDASVLLRTLPISSNTHMPQDVADKMNRIGMNQYDQKGTDLLMPRNKPM